MFFDKQVASNDGVLSGFFESPQPKKNLLFKFIKSRFGKSLLSQSTFRLEGQKIQIESDSDLFPQVDGEAVGKEAVHSLVYSILLQKFRFYQWSQAWEKY